MSSLFGLGNSPFGLLSSMSTDEQRKLAVWAKGYDIPGRDRAMWCWDANYKVIKFSEHGNRNSPYGWEIDHHPTPKCFGGSDDVCNLRPLNCGDNASHGGLLSSLLTGN